MGPRLARQATLDAPQAGAQHTLYGKPLMRTIHRGRERLLRQHQQYTRVPPQVPISHHVLKHPCDHVPRQEIRQQLPVERRDTGT